jgi:hypothetical protein
MATAKKKGIAKSYKNHRAGSMKGRVHEVFDKFSKDPEKARAAALKINPNVSTVRNWFSQFRAS